MLPASCSAVSSRVAGIPEATAAPLPIEAMRERIDLRVQTSTESTVSTLITTAMGI
jgi:hypothetical protein